MAHLLVTGGAGYIGSHTLRGLQRAGHSAVVLRRPARGARAAGAGRAAGARRRARPRRAVARVFAEHGPFDGVLHFAALLSVPESVANPLLYYSNNVMGSRVLLEAALAAGTRAFVLSSTAAVYGHPAAQPIPETAPLAPINPYGATQGAWSSACSPTRRRPTACAGRRCATSTPAAPIPTGDLGECHDPETHLIPVALEAAAGLRDALPLYGTDYPTRDGTCVRDYVHVSDLATAHVLALEALIGGRSLGAAQSRHGHGVTNREVLAAVERVVGRPVPVKNSPRRPGDPPELVADAQPLPPRIRLGAAALGSRQRGADGLGVAPPLAASERGLTP